MATVSQLNEQTQPPSMSRLFATRVQFNLKFLPICRYFSTDFGRYRYISFCLETTPSLSCAEIISKIFFHFGKILTRTYLLELNKQ